MGRKGNVENQLDRIVHLVIKEDFVTATFVQRKLGISYLAAQSILQKLDEMGYIESYKPFKKLKVLKHHLLQ